MVSKIGKVLIKIDRICDYLPISPVCNLVNLFEKCAFRGRSEGSIASNSYVSYVKSKKNWRCAVLLLPVLGNLIIAIHDIVQHRRNKTIEIKGTSQPERLEKIRGDGIDTARSVMDENLRRLADLEEKVKTINKHLGIPVTEAN